MSVKAQVVDVAKSLRLSLSLISSIFCLSGDGRLSEMDGSGYVFVLGRVGGNN